jgi:hypothetical protein
MILNENRILRMRNNIDRIVMTRVNLLEGFPVSREELELEDTDFALTNSLLLVRRKVLGSSASSDGPKKQPAAKENQCKAKKGKLKIRNRGLTSGVEHSLKKKVAKVNRESVEIAKRTFDKEAGFEKTLILFNSMYKSLLMKNRNMA